MLFKMRNNLERLSSASCRPTGKQVNSYMYQVAFKGPHVLIVASFAYEGIKVGESRGAPTIHSDLYPEKCIRVSNTQANSYRGGYMSCTTRYPTLSFFFCTQCLFAQRPNDI